MMIPSWYQRWFGYTPEYQALTWKMLGLVAVLLIVYVALPLSLAVLILYLVLR